MPKKPATPKTERYRRSDPKRVAPDRSAASHLRRSASSSSESVRSDDPKKSANQKPDTIQQAISDAVTTSYRVIEEQIRQGQLAAERLREGLTNSTALNTDATTVVDDLVATTKDIGAAWLDFLAVTLRAVAPQPTNGSPRGMRAGGAPSGQNGTTRATTVTTTTTNTSGNITTVSSITTPDPATPGVPATIAVKSTRPTRVTLDLRPPSEQFLPFIPPLRAADPKLDPLTDISFALSPDQTEVILTIVIPDRQPAGTYTGAVVDGRTHRPGGTICVIVGT